MIWLLALAGCQSRPAPPLEKQETELNAMTNDWANRARYRADNNRLGPPATGETRVVFMGDSITDAWPNLGTIFSRRHYVGRGISGQTTSQMLVRFQQDVIALGPKVVVILAGTNDVAGNTGPFDPELTRGSLAAMAELAQAHGIRVMLSSVLPAFDYPWRPGLQPAAKIVALNAWLKDYAAHHGCIYLDYFSSMADARPGLQPRYSEDGVHPNAAGYAVMEPMVEQAIAEALLK
ncbi:MAG TPA: SGNH/GDSL hydrolase family protein [Lacunisphaera sp.]|nr:SGNH/GDSL hydrolase family protein [Lacunisphaera sp.]